MAVRSILGLVLVFLILPLAHAQGVFGFEVLGGLYRTQDADGLKPMGGAALRFKLSPFVGIEASVNYREESYSSGSIAVKSWPVMVTVQYFRSLQCFSRISGRTGSSRQ